MRRTGTSFSGGELEAARRPEASRSTEGVHTRSDPLPKMQEMETAVASPLGRRIPYPHLAGWSIAIAVTFIVTSVQLAIIVEWLRRQTSTLEFVARGLPGRTGLEPIHSRLTMLTRGVALFLAVGFVLWVIWSFQARANLRAGGERSSRKPWTAAASWVGELVLSLPIFSMWHLWRRSEPYEPVGGRRRLRATPLLWLWSLACIATLILVFNAFRALPLEGAAPAQLIRRNDLLVPACLAGIAAAVLTTVLVIRIGGRVRLKTEGGDWHSWTDRGARRRPG
jgi:hypothetical protein